MATGTTGLATVDVDVETGRVLASRSIPTPPGPRSDRLSVDGRLVASVSLSSPNAITSVTVRDLDNDGHPSSLPDIPKKMSNGALAFIPDDKALALGFDDGSIEVWDLASMSLRTTLRGHPRDYEPLFLKFSPDGSTLASFAIARPKSFSLDLVRIHLANLRRDQSHPSELILIDVPSGRRLIRSKLDGLVVFSPDGKSVATSNDDGRVWIHDMPGRR